MNALTLVNSIRPCKNQFKLTRRFLQSTSNVKSSTGTTLDHKSKLHGVYHWDYERAISIALIPLLATPFVAGTGIAAVDFGIGVLLPVHCHLGLMQVIRDYAPKRRSPGLWTVSLVSMYCMTGLALYGAYRINTEDVGITEATKRLWTGKLSKYN